MKTDEMKRFKEVLISQYRKGINDALSDYLQGVLSKFTDLPADTEKSLPYLFGYLQTMNHCEYHPDYHVNEFFEWLFKSDLLTQKELTTLQGIAEKVIHRALKRYLIKHNEL